MQKKLKTGQYRNKSQFAHDLDLIWDNCFIYNASPQHPLRRNAHFMRKKANHLLEFLGEKTDVKDMIRHWGTGEAAGAARASPARDADTKPAVDAAPGEAPAGPSSPPAPAEVPQEVPDLVRLPFAQQPALLRRPESEATFAELDAELAHRRSVTGEAGERLAALERPPLLNPLGEVLPERGADWWSLCGQTAFLRAGVPAVPHRGRTAGEAGARRSDELRSRLPAARPGIPRMMARNIHTLRRLHRTHQKFFELAEAVEFDLPIPPSLTDVSSDEEEEEPAAPAPRAPAEHADEGAACPPAPRLSEAYALEQVRWQVQMLLAHVGFDGSHATAVQVLTDVAREFIMTLGRTLRVYSDRCAARMNPQEMVLHTLLETGNLRLDTLEHYIKNDVERYGARLRDWLRRLHAAYREQLQGLGRGALEDDALFARDGEALALGQFADDLGDDFFGFRELGLDRELGLSSLSVPGRLFFGRSNTRSTAAPGEPDEAPPTLEQPPPCVPLTSASLAVQIGLLRPWYADQLAKRRAAGATPPDVLPDQAPERPRYKVPTSGKLPPRPMVGDAPAGSPPAPAPREAPAPTPPRAAPAKKTTPGPKRKRPRATA